MTNLNGRMISFYSLLLLNYLVHGSMVNFL